MGAAAFAHLSRAALVLAALAARAGADPCTGRSDTGRPFETCFDVGNRLSVTAGSDGFGGELQLRQIVKFEDDPDLEWKLEHGIARVEAARFDGSITGVVYGGRFLRHTRDGHIVLPLASSMGGPRKVFLPFDIGAVVEAGRVTVDDRPTMTGPTPIHVGVVKTAAVIDLWRSKDFRRRLMFGPVARWDVDVARAPVAIARHVVAPFSAAMAALHLESHDGLYVADLAVEAGTAWTSDAAWRPNVQASASIERILLAINDRPIALVIGGVYDRAEHVALARIGARLVLFHAADSRVSHLH